MNRAEFLTNCKLIVDRFRPSSEYWHGELADMGWLKRHALFSLRVVRLVYRGFRNDQCDLHASALTYYTLMSLVPLLALALSLARVFGGEDLARERISREITEIGAQLSSNVKSESDLEVTNDFVARITNYAENLFDQIGNISFSTLGGVGLIVLIWAAITMLTQVEGSFNSVWGAPSRAMWRKCSDYITIIIVVPFLALSATTIPIIKSVASFATTHSGGFLSEEGLAVILRNGTVCVLSVATFVVLLMFVPNTKVKFKSALIGGVFTAIIFAVWFHICTAAQVGVVKYSKWYGGFAALPILLAWTFVSWEIILLGAEITFAVQHSETFFRDEGAHKAGAMVRCRLALALVTEMGRRLENGLQPLSVITFSKTNKISGRLIFDVIDGLVNDGIVGSLSSDPDLFILLKSPKMLTVSDIFFSVVNRGTSSVSLGVDNLETPKCLRHLEYDLAQHMDISIASLDKRADEKTV